MGAATRRVHAAPALKHERTSLRLRADGALRLVLVADTHSHPHPDTAKFVAKQKPDHILHAGDIGDLVVLDELATIAPVTAVRGNIDTRAAGIPDVVTLSLDDDDGTLTTLLLMHIALYGPTLRGDAAKLAHAEHASIIVCGHSHVPFLGRDKGLVVMNPGSIGPRRFHLPILFGVMDASRERIAMHHVSCETGSRWEP